MSTNPKLDKLQKLIDAFVAQLLALNDGNKIPTAWKSNTRKALDVVPKKRPGRPRDYAKDTKIMKGLIVAVDEIGKPYTKHHNPAKIKDQIAEESGVSQRTVGRRIKTLKGYLAGNSQIEPKDREVIAGAFAEVVGPQIMKELAVEQQRDLLKARRQNLKAPPPK